ncbi:unnamed protein product [Oikopleura dioica]|uniref:Uncharacterized protein n=1 Tax=Oikopleura dioica TaxID=34765 RepID=E4YSB2_OIKDI|nr:unnamed protein product [Oikopleura dioica]
MGRSDCNAAARKAKKSITKLAGKSLSSKVSAGCAKAVQKTTELAEHFCKAFRDRGAGISVGAHFGRFKAHLELTTSPENVIVVRDRFGGQILRKTEQDGTHRMAAAAAGNTTREVNDPVSIQLEQLTVDDNRRANFEQRLATERRARRNSANIDDVSGYIVTPGAASYSQ